jgi:hypothetical protein
MLYMVVEKFKDKDPVPVYRHLRDKGRGLPDGLKYVDSWVESNFDRCFQLMECDDPKLFDSWMAHWREVGVSFEVVPVMQSKEVRAIVEPKL